MNTIDKIQEGLNFLDDVFEKCHADASFKQEFIANPVSAIESFKGVTMNVPSNRTIRVEDQSDRSFVYLNIPAEPKLEDLELTEEQLEKVSGGVFWWGVAAGLAANAIYEFCNGFVDGARGKTN
jgi:hypothetical protein